MALPPKTDEDGVVAALPNSGGAEVVAPKTEGADVAAAPPNKDNAVVAVLPPKRDAEADGVEADALLPKTDDEDVWAAPPNNDGLDVLAVPKGVEDVPLFPKADAVLPKSWVFGGSADEPQGAIDGVDDPPNADDPNDDAASVVAVFEPNRGVEDVGMPAGAIAAELVTVTLSLVDTGATVPVVESASLPG